MLTLAECAILALNDMLSWLRYDGILCLLPWACLTGEGGTVAIYDGTNSTISRRQMIIKRIHEEKKNIGIKVIASVLDSLLNPVQLMFLEIICNNSKIVDKNIKRTKLSAPDYVGMDPDQAVEGS